MDAPVADVSVNEALDKIVQRTERSIGWHRKERRSSQARRHIKRGRLILRVSPWRGPVETSDVAACNVDVYDSKVDLGTIQNFSCDRYTAV